MAQAFFEIEKGLALNSSVFLSGTGVPGGTTDTDAVGVGSYYLRTDSTGGIYHKKTTGSGTDKWEKMSSEDFVLSNSGSASWREPSLVRDNTSYTDIADAESTANGTNNVDSIGIAVNDRLLFTNLTAGNNNIYIVSGGTGAWTFTEDTNLATDGDVTYIQDGTDAGKQYGYNGTAWVLINQASSDELGFLRVFVGKTGAGSETPSYSSAVYVTNGDNLEVAVGKLDAQINTNAGAITTLQTDLLDARTEAIQSNVTTLTVVDTMLVDDVAAAKWFIHVEGNLLANAPDKHVIEVSATHDGHVNGAGADASDAEYSVSGLLEMGTAITGLVINVDVNGAGAAQTMRLTVVSTTAVDVRSVREVITFA